MTVKLTLRGDPQRTIEFRDNDAHRYTAQEFHDGRVHVTRTPRVGSGAGLVVEEFKMADIEFLENGWPSGGGPIE